jgi:hypothetical protein
MSRSRAWGVLASLVASLVMTAGVTTLTTSAASAAPQQYPPAASALTVNRGTVRVGEAVRATGRGFGRNEPVHVTVLYRPQHWNHDTTLFQSYSARTSSKGKFSVSVRMHLPGTAIVRAHGARSGKSASASVRVLLFGYGSVLGHGKGGGWPFTRAGYVSSANATTAVAAPSQTQKPSNAPALAAAGLGATALAGSVLITRRQLRRRRKS